MTSDCQGSLALSGEPVAGSCDVHSDGKSGPVTRREKRGSEITADPYPYHDWSRLVGTPVEIRKDFSIVRAGIVDDVMPDSSVLWLASDSSNGRELFAAAEGYQVWIRPQKLDGKHCYQMAADHLPPPTT